MEICPKCGQASVDFDSYRKVKRCYIDGCTAIITKEGYSQLERKSNKLLERIEITAKKRRVVKQYKVDL